MMLPKRIRIGPINYRVIEKQFAIEEECTGRYWSNRQIIEVEKRLHKDRKLQALFHEIVHAICEGRQIKMKESAVDNVATAFMALLRDNPQLKELI